MRKEKEKMKNWNWLSRFCCVSLFLLSPFSFLHSQEISYDVDTACGCDIMYVEGIQTTREGDLYGFRHKNGTVLTPNIYRHVDQFYNGYCHVWVDDTTVALAPGEEPPLLAGLIDSTGREIIPCIYHGVDHPSSGRILVAKEGFFGYADLQGNIVIPIQFRDASPFIQNRAAVGIIVDSFFLFYTFIDTLGHQLFPPVYQNARPFIDGFATVRLYDRWGIIDTLGNEVIPNVYEAITLPDHGTLFAGDSLNLALFNLNSQSPSLPLTKPVYYPVTHVADGRIGVSRNGKEGFLDLQGNEVIPCEYDEIGLFRQGRAFVRKGDLCGIIDTLGHIILPLEYHDRTPKGMKYVYYDSLALVEQNGRLGFVDLDGRFVVPLVLEEAYQFSEGLAGVRKDGHWGYVDTHGDLYLPLIFDIVAPFQWGRADVYFQGKPYTIDRQGRCVRNCNGIVSFR